MTHGTRYGYMKAKCRCTECKAWHAARARAKYARRAATTTTPQEKA